MSFIINSHSYLVPYEESLKTQKLEVSVEMPHGTMVGWLEKVDAENGLYWVNGCKFWIESNKFTTLKMENKGDNKMTTLENGVVFHKLEVANEFYVAQSFFELNENTEMLSARDAYNYRVETDKVGTYEITIERFDDFSRFKEMLENDLCYNGEKRDKIRSQWYMDIITNDEYQQQLNDLKECSCKKCQFRLPTMEEWTSGLYKETVWNDYLKMDKVKESKLGKAMLKNGISQTIIDFYSAQIKTEKQVYITISDRVQHINGMSNYAMEDSWNQYNGTSCQDTRHGGDMSISLVGSLHDNKLFIAMLHDELNDTLDMTDKLLARNMMRLVVIDGEQYMIPTNTYGNNETMDMLDKGLQMLEEVGIYGMNIKEEEFDGDNIERHTESANGCYEMITEEEVNVCETIEEHVSIDCPMCMGSGEYTAYSERGNDREVSCPMCGGDGRYEVYVYEEIDTYVTIEESNEIEVYGGGEGYTHRGYSISINVNLTKIERDMVKYGKKLV
jgi:hypothetical protein